MKKRAPILTAPPFLLRFRKLMLNAVPVFGWGSVRRFMEARTSVRTSRRWAANPVSRREEFEVADL